MKKFGLVIVVLGGMAALAGLDYRVNFFGKTPLFASTQLTAPAASPLEGAASLPPSSPSATSEPVVSFSGNFPLLLAASSAELPYVIQGQQKVFDLFGIFDLKALPGLQVLRYDLVPANSNPALSPLQVYELWHEGQTAGITFLSLKARLSAQVDPIELNSVKQTYAKNALFYNPAISVDNAFLLTENGILLGFVYPKASTETFAALQAFLPQLPGHLAQLPSR